MAFNKSNCGRWRTHITRRTQRTRITRRHAFRESDDRVWCGELTNDVSDFPLVDFFMLDLRDISDIMGEQCASYQSLHHLRLLNIGSNPLHSVETTAYGEEEAVCIRQLERGS